VSGYTHAYTHNLSPLSLSTLMGRSIGQARKAVCSVNPRHLEYIAFLKWNAKLKVLAFYIT